VTAPPARPSGEAPVRETQSFGEGLDVRIGLRWERGSFEVSSRTGLRVRVPGEEELVVAGGRRLEVTVRDGSEVRVAEAGGRFLRQGPAVRIHPVAESDLYAGERRVRGRLELSARADSLFAVNVLPLEDYLRGVVPREIGPRPAEDTEAVAAQAVAARTYTVKRLSQYGSLPFDLYGSVQDQAYDGVGGENAVADAAIRETEGLILTDARGPIEAYYSSTCAGRRSDIAEVWPHREVYDCLRGGPDGDPGREWCASSRHFAPWTETWDGGGLSRLVRDNAPAMLELPPGSVKGELTDVRITGRGPSGRVLGIEYVTTAGRWTVPGDRNRWVLRRPDGGILRSVQVELEVHKSGGRVARVTATGRGNGHGVGMCQVGAIGRAKAGASFREILEAYYPGAVLRRIRGEDLPEGRTASS
jgi:stage II sporulation protein D